MLQPILPHGLIQVQLHSIFQQIDYTKLGNKKKKEKKKKTHILPMRFVSQYNITKKKLTIAINIEAHKSQYFIHKQYNKKKIKEKRNSL